MSQQVKAGVNEYINEFIDIWFCEIVTGLSTCHLFLDCNLHLYPYSSMEQVEYKIVAKFGKILEYF